jgi:hypothetical protein
MGVFATLLSATPQSFTFQTLAPDQVPDGSIAEPLRRDECYLNIFIQSLRIPKVREFTTRYYGAVYSYVSAERLGGEKIHLQAVAIPNNLKDIDPEAADLIVSTNLRVVGPVPYRGGDIGIELGLVAVKSGDFASSYLQLVEDIAKTAGVGLVQTAMPFARLLERGIGLLMGTGANVKLLLGLAKTIEEPCSGTSVIIGTDPKNLEVGKLKIRKDDRKLLAPDGTEFMSAPYLVFRITGTKERDDWANIEYLRTAYEAVSSAVNKKRQTEATAALEQFRLNALLSPDLLTTDANRLYEKTEALVKLAFQEVMRGRRSEEKPLPALEELDLYDKRAEKCA